MLIKELIKRKINTIKNERIKRVLDIASFEPVDNKHPASVTSIGIVVPALHKFTGGHTSIIRLGSMLVDRGFVVHYISYENQPKAEMIDVIKTNYSAGKGECFSIEEAEYNCYDLILATNWISVYWAKKLKGYKAYFVQDYEPYFYMVDEEYELAKETYELGFHIISLGKWNIEQINKFCMNKGIQSHIDFPYEPTEYQFVKKDFGHIIRDRRIKLAVYTKENGKRMANLLQYLLLKAKQEFEIRGYELDISFFGLKKGYRVIVGKNMGKLNKKEMHQLYIDSDFGLVASMTNISLVPYEMMGSGLPVIEFESGSFSSFLPKESALLINFDYHSLVDGIEKCISEPDILDEMIMAGQKAIASLSWNSTCDQFVNIINTEVIKGA